MGERYAFTSKLVRFTMLYCVEVPAAVSKAVGRARVPVVVRVAKGAPFRATLLPSGSGRHRLFLNGEMREAAGVKLGDRVALEVRVDREPREVPLPPDLSEALKDEGVLETWTSMPPGKREHLVRWIDEAAHETTRQKRVARAVEEALARHEKRIDREM
jgi:Bacteriocin-protection, YdeI or OmpD-Associated/Domain of unknown function (DUF1905)